MSKLNKAIEFLDKHGRITAMDIIAECKTVSPHKYIQLMKAKVGLRELENTGKNYKIFVKADQQMRLLL